MNSIEFNIKFRNSYKDWNVWPKIGVVGGGVVGISTALAISRTFPKCKIIIYSDKHTPNTTGNKFFCV